MADWIDLLLPTPSWFLEGGVNSLIVCLVYGMGALFLGVWIWIFHRRRVFNRRRNELLTIIEQASSVDALGSRAALKRKASEGDPKIASLWREFDETLVLSADGNHLYNTVDAEYFFNERTLAPRLVHNRLLTAVPSLLTAIGVLGTFLGLTMGLGGLNVESTLSETADTQELLEGIQAMIGAAGVAFITSVWGVGLSLAMNLIERSAERRVIGDISSIQQKIDHVYTRITPEESLLSIQHSSEQSRQELQELHERIGDRLQEAVQTVSSDIQGALSGAIAEAMAPAMENLVSTTTEQSTEVFSALVERFSAAFTDIGSRQAEALDTASSDLNQSIEVVSQEFKSMAESMQLHHERHREQQDALLLELSTLTTALNSSSADLSSAATKLTTVSADVRDAGASIGGSLSQTAATLMSVHARALEQAERVAALQREAHQLGYDLDSAATGIAGSVSSLSQHMETVSALQSNFQEAIRSDVSAVSDMLKDHVEDLESQVSKWLTNYSADIEAQVESRMMLWNTQSQEYANRMLAVAQTLADVIDGIEQTRQAQATQSDAQIDAAPKPSSEAQEPQA